ncbi:putative inorganic phosphate cotransporter [Trichonephila clavipes]|nr:putative inorganic phosphate cotransporter [Trichonephila clavipes]
MAKPSTVAKAEEPNKPFSCFLARNRQVTILSKYCSTASISLSISVGLTSIKKIVKLYLSSHRAESSREMFLEFKKVTSSEAKRSFLQYRYLVALLQFFGYFEINVFRLVTSISVVAMVNNTAVDSHKTTNVSVASCPFNFSNLDENHLPENTGEFDWSPAIQGYILGAGFLGYVVTQMPGGMLAECYGAKFTVVGGLFLSSLGHILSPLAARSSAYLLIVMQLVRGLGQLNAYKLASLVKSHRKQRSAFDQVSEFDRGRIVAYRDCGLSFRKIRSRIGRNQTTVMRICDRWMQEGSPTAIFQQDNARPHVARIVQRFFVNHQIKLLPWLARFPDLSPIENMWSMVDQRLIQITPQLPHQINFGNVWKLLVGLLYRNPKSL